MQNPISVKADSEASYFGLKIAEDSLVLKKNPRLGSITLDNWVKKSI